MDITDRSNREQIEDIQIQIERINKEIADHENEIRRLQNDRGALMKEMGNLMDSKTEQNLLTAVYEQRKAMREKAKKQ